MFSNHYLTNLDNYMHEFSKRDIEILFKQSLKTGKIEIAKRLYTVCGDKSLLECVWNKELKEELSNVDISDRDCQPGKPQTSAEILASLEKLEKTAVWDLTMSDERRKHLQEFIPNLKSVLIKNIVNKERTRARKMKNNTTGESENVVNTNTTKTSKRKLPKKTKLHDKPLRNNLIPPTFLGMSFADLFVKENIASYQSISSQAAQQTVKKADEAYKSFFAFHDSKSSLPQYNRTDKFNLVYQKQSFFVIHDESNKVSKIRLSLGNERKRILKSSKTHQKKKQNKDENYLTYTFPIKLLKGKDICEIELVPSQYSTSRSYKLVIKHNINIPPVQNDTSQDGLGKASIDLGVSNLATLFSPRLAHPVIYSGRPLIGLNKLFNSVVDNTKSKIKKMWNSDTSQKTQSLFTNRSNRINNFFNRVSSHIINLCQQLQITQLIIGYNTNWKSRVKMGKLNNRKFYEIPYRKFISMLFDKGEKYGIHVVENEESYTSKCDSLALEEVGHHDEYMGRRIKRGLFQSSTNVLVNADVNGAINIMRKYIAKACSNLTGALNIHLQTTPRSNLCNPLRLFRTLTPMTI